MYQTYGGEVAFFIVYIREAHPVGSRRPDREVRVQDPSTLDERVEVAGQCVGDLDLPMPTLIDEIRNTTEAAYDAWPDRLFLVGVDGKLAYKGGHGPRGFKTGDLEVALKTVLKASPKKDANGSERSGRGDPDAF